jgi:hypothetical protein
MPPIFPPRSNTFARISLLGTLILLGAVVGLAVLYVHSPAVNKVGVDVPQPVDFPHGFHVAAVGLDCRYCHETVDTSSFAGMPPTQTCMSCHSQIRLDSALLQPVRDSWETGEPIAWNRVNSLPDYTYFNHSIHVNKGMGCETCHGRTDEQRTAVKAETFYMAWCLECHRQPEKYVRPLDQVYTMGFSLGENQEAIGASLVREYNIRPASVLTDCSICHR